MCAGTYNVFSYNLISGIEINQQCSEVQNAYITSKLCRCRKHFMTGTHCAVDSAGDSLCQRKKNGFLLGLTMQWLLHQHRGGIRGEMLNSPQKKEK